MGRLDHGFTQRRLDRFVDDELPGEDVDRVVVHVIECPECSAGVRFLLRIRAALIDVAMRRHDPDL